MPTNRPSSSIRRLAVGAVTLAAGLGGLVLVAGPASAKAIDVADATGDVQSVTQTACGGGVGRAGASSRRALVGIAVRRSMQDPTCTDDGYTQTVTDEPDVTVRDISSLRVSNRRHQVVLVEHYSELSKEPGNIAYVGVVRGNHGRTVVTTTTRNARTGRVRTAVDTARGKTLHCGATSRFDFAAAAITVTVPARCLEAPTKVQANLVVLNETDNGSTSVTYVVDGAVGSFADSFAGASPWVGRG